MNKVLGIEEKNFLTLVKRMNSFAEKNKVIATQVFPVFDRQDEEGSYFDQWYALVYYESNSQEKGNFAKATSFPKPSPVKTNDKLATIEQKNLLRKLNVKFPENITKLKAMEEISKRIG